MTTRRFTFKQGSSDKFWEITLEGERFTVRFGRRGTAGQTRTTTFATADAARLACEEMIREKVAKGYRETEPATGMNADEFWNLIERSRKGAEDPDEQAGRLEESLGMFSEAAILDFDRHYEERVAEAYRWDLWGAAFVINGGCSDDGFEYFLGWLIAQGREYYEAALADPEQAGRRARPGEMVECESIAYAAAKAYEAKTGRDDFYDRRAKVPRGEPAGASWEEEDLPRLFPKLTARFGAAPPE